jgi:hypothetical protein
LNTLLELKVENERLQQHLNVLRAHSQRLSATQSAQHVASYTGDDLSAQLATNNLGLPSRSTRGGDSSRPQYSMSHEYEAGGDFPTISPEDDGDAERRRKKVNRFHQTNSRCFFFTHDALPSSKNHLVGSNIFATRVVAQILQNGER